MDYGMIGKIEKAKRYAEERERFCFDQFNVTFSGENNEHQVSFDNGVFHCDCEFFVLRAALQPHDGAGAPAEQHAARARRGLTQPVHPQPGEAQCASPFFYVCAAIRRRAGIIPEVGRGAGGPRRCLVLGEAVIRL